MYRDDPLDDELELREIVGDPAVDGLIAVADDRDTDPVATAVDVLRLLQGWVSDDAAGRWFHQPQRRLDERTPLAALAHGDEDDVLDAARAYAAAQS
ncbi:MAG: antitoxin Xre/MbcA/ParS toxin-binding domain-containing protein [Nitriliruptorales bacterium]|nr:antitoxin Xre/MbcA/ParS toxin-binding domain-containing protein [Nitriliruptorales bacterium]